MAKKIIQIPIDEGLLKELDYLSKKQNKARAEVIREACQRYLTTIEIEELEHQHVKGYERIPETSEIGKAQEAMLSEILPEESW
jgi:metal-responsive CopG/Arc/MetJ family transcriptional regulator